MILINISKDGTIKSLDIQNVMTYFMLPTCFDSTQTVEITVQTKNQQYSNVDSTVQNYTHQTYRLQENSSLHVRRHQFWGY